MSFLRGLREQSWSKYILPVVVLVAVLIFPLFRPPLDGFMDDCILALAYVVMALGLNLVVGFAGLLDLGYVAFYALGSMVVGWWASDFFTGAGGDKGIHIGVSGFAATLPGIHVNFLILLVGAVIVCAIAGAIIGLPTLRLRGDYIAIVTLAFGEIIGRIFANGDEITIFGDYKLSNGRQSIAPIDSIDLPFLDPFDSALNLRPYYWTAFALVLVVLFVNFRLRDSKLGRAWIALREDEVAAASMGVPLVKTKLLAYATGGAFGGISGAFLGTYFSSVNANSFQFGFSIFILGMVILGGLGSIWGVVLGAVALSFVNSRLIPDVLDQGWIGHKLQDLGLNFQFT
jgi:branched-chain amino acid transport system permease protein